MQSYKLMKILLNTSFLFLTLLIYEQKSFALNDFQIREFCKRDRRKLTCIKNLKIKRLDLLKGNRIEIPVIPYKR